MENMTLLYLLNMFFVSHFNIFIDIPIHPRLTSRWPISKRMIRLTKQGAKGIKQGKLQKTDKVSSRIA